jgi:hypothetical protein
LSSNLIAPLKGEIKPAMARSKVVLPQPDGPNTAANAPDGIVKDNSFNTGRLA